MRFYLILEVFKNFVDSLTNDWRNVDPFFYGFRLDAKDVGILQLLIVLEGLNEWSEPVAQRDLPEHVLKWEQSYFPRLFSEVHGIKENQRMVGLIY